MFRKIFRAGTRRSPLALKQAEEILNKLKEFYPDFKAEIIGIDTYGDKDKVTPISDIEGTDFFTREIDEALLRNELDFAIHSAKDLSEDLGPRLYIAAITESVDPYDALVSKNNLLLEELPYRAKIGASSLRRKTQLKSYRSDFRITDIRGNIQERLKRLDQSDLDAIVIAACGLKRLGLEYRITERIPFEILKPHFLQGSLAVLTRSEDLDLIRVLSTIDTRLPITL